MLTSLFGELAPTRKQPGEEGWAQTLPAESLAASQQAFAATGLVERTATSVNDRGQMIERHVRDLFVTGSPAEAMRRHFAVRGDGESTSNSITLYDPMRVWAPIVVKALSDASGQPVERLLLREQSSLRTLGVIERTRVPRRMDDTLKVYHAEVRPEEGEGAQIAAVLMERAHLTAVIVGPMHPESIEQMLSMLQAATLRSTWHCPNLLFLLPPAAVWIAEKIDQMSWPRDVRVTVVNETMNGTSAVWNALLDCWNHSKTLPAWDDAAPREPLPEGPQAAQDAAALRGAAVPAAEGPRGTLGLVDPVLAAAMAQSVLEQDGVLGCVVLDARSGQALATDVRAGSEGQPQLDMPAVTAAATQVLRAHRLAARQMAVAEPIDEVVVSIGPRQEAIRAVNRHGGIYLVAVFDKRRTNLALVRYRMVEAEKQLG